MRKIVAPLALLALTIAGPAYAGNSKSTVSKSSAKSMAVSKSSAKTALARSQMTSSSKKSASRSSLFAAFTKAQARSSRRTVVPASSRSSPAPTSRGSAIVGTAAVAPAATSAVAISTACSGSDISPGAAACAGFVSGNIINSGGGQGDPLNPLSANEEQMAQLLAQLGFAYTGDSDGLEQALANASGDVTFSTLLSGSTIIGVHYGNGQNSPGGQGSGDDTAFYRFDANLLADNTFRLNFGSSSTVTLFQTNASGVPEPGTWAMMLLGFGFVGGAARRQRRNRKLPQLA